MIRGRHIQNDRMNRGSRRRGRLIGGEALESRELLTGYTVTSLQDSGSGTLREAINLANSSAGADTIDFAVGAGAQTIALATTLPQITGVVTINGPTEPISGGAGARRPLVTIDLAAVSTGTLNAAGLDITATAAGTVIHGLAITNVPGSGVAGGYGIRITGGSGNVISGNYLGVTPLNVAAGNGTGVYVDSSTSNTIGGTGAADRNVISGNRKNGIELYGLGAGVGVGNVIQGNYIGTNSDGSDAIPNVGTGIFSWTGGHTIGGTSAGARNVISGNNGIGIHFFGSGAGGNLVQGNYIGTTADGDGALGNKGEGLFIQGNKGNIIGGTTAAAANVISANAGGINFLRADLEVPIAANVVEGNYIGTGKGGSGALGNIGYGIRLQSDGELIGGTDAGAGNVIANTTSDTFGKAAGVTFILNAQGHQVLRNAIYGNGGLGIDFNDDGQVLANDLGDVDTTAQGYSNDGQNYPVITGAAAGGGITSVTGTFNSLASRTYTLQFFANDQADVSGYGEGKTYLGQTTVTTNASGNATFTVPFALQLTATQFVTATATDQSTHQTSEFSRAVPVTVLPAADLAISQTATPNPVNVGNEVEYTLTVQNSGPKPSTNVQIVDTLPPGAQFVSATGGIQPSNGVLTFVIPSIDVGSSASVVFRIRTTVAGPIQNTASVSSDTIDPNSANDSSTVVVNAVPAPGQSVISFGATSFNVAEAGGEGLVTISRTNGTDAVSVRFQATAGTATAGTDFIARDEIVTFAAGEKVKTIKITVGDDPDVEDDETVNLTLSAPTGGAVLGLPTTSQLVILNDDPTPPPAGRIQFGAAVFSVAEGARVMSIPVNRVGGVTGKISALFSTADGTATAGSDYEPRNFRIYFSEGDDAPKFVMIRFTDDADFEADETVNLVLSDPEGGSLGGPSTALLTIINDDVRPPTPAEQTVQFGAATYSFAENAGNATVTVVRSGSVGTVKVNVSTGGGTARPNERYLPIGTTITFAPGETIKTVDVPLIDTTVYEGTETVQLTLSLPEGGTNLGTPSTAVLSILDNEASPPDPVQTPGVIVFSSAGYLAEEQRGRATFNLTRTGGTAGAVTVDVVARAGTATAGDDYSPARQTITFADGQSDAVVELTVVDDTLIEGNEVLGLFLENVTGGARIGALDSSVLTIEDDDHDTVAPIATSPALNPSGSGIGSVAVTFSEPMDESTAGNAANYRLVNVGRDGLLGTADDRQIALQGVSFNPANNTVTVVPSSPLAANSTFALTVLASSAGQVADKAGNLLDGDRNGLAGGDYVVQVTRGANVRYLDGDGDTVQLRLTGGGSLDVVRDRAGNAISVNVGQPRPGRTVLTGQVRKGRSGDGLAQIGTLTGIDQFGVVRSRLTTPPFVIGSQPAASLDSVAGSSTGRRTLRRR